MQPQDLLAPSVPYIPVCQETDFLFWIPAGQTCGLWWRCESEGLCIHRTRHWNPAGTCDVAPKSGLHCRSYKKTQMQNYWRDFFKRQTLRFSYFSLFITAFSHKVAAHHRFFCLNFKNARSISSPQKQIFIPRRVESDEHKNDFRKLTAHNPASPQSLLWTRDLQQKKPQQWKCPIISDPSRSDNILGYSGNWSN